MRITRSEMYLDIAKKVAERSTCPRGKVGAVIVTDRGVLVTGYSGAPHGFPHCEDVGCAVEKFAIDGREVEHCTRTIHAEMNAILFAAKNGVAIKDSWLLCTHAPCQACAKGIINAGIRGVSYVQEYHAHGIMVLLGAELDVYRYSSRGTREGYWKLNYDQTDIEFVVVT